MIDLEPMTYDQWKAERQAYLDSRTSAQVTLDAQYQEYNRNDAHYNTLGDRIRHRQLALVPTAGSGLLQFLDTTGKLAKGVGTVIPIARKLAILTDFTEELVKERLGY
tara:strand:- start:41 stop:364 length:324 start_codon:yes stop_codon:yes gene_type:complete